MFGNMPMEDSISRGVSRRADTSITAQSLRDAYGFEFMGGTTDVQKTAMVHESTGKEYLNYAGTHQDLRALRNYKSSFSPRFKP
jgi:hypothetical protein